LEINFSVVIPLYNKIDFIGRAIRSVLGQSYQSFEIIIVNDGSTDGSEREIVLIDDPRIKIIHQENSGASSARNRGVQEARSEYIAFLDADDEWKSNHLDIFRSLIEDFPESGMYGQSYEYILNDKHITPSSLKKYPIHWRGYLDNYLELAASFHPFSSSSVCLRKAVLFEIGGFPLGVHFAEDLITWIKIFLRYRIGFCHSLSSYYYMGESNNISLKSALGYGYLENYLENLLSENAFSEKTCTALYEYYTSRILNICSQILIFGNKKQCRDLLYKCKQTDRYKSRWLRLFIFSFFPLVFYKFLFSTWNKIKKTRFLSKNGLWFDNCIIYVF